MTETLADIVMPRPIMGVTINTVFLHPLVRNLLYAAIVVSFIAGLVVFLRRSPSFGTAVRKALVLSFFCSGLLAAVQADIGWSVLVSREYEELSGLSVDGKLARIEGQLYDLNKRAKTVMRDTYRIYAKDSYLSFRSQYFLLPLRRQDNGRDIVVLGDPTARYDQATRTFMREDLRLSNMDLALLYAPEYYVLRGP